MDPNDPVQQLLSNARPVELLKLYDHLQGHLVFLKNAKGQYVYFNRNCCEYFGLSSPGEYIGKTDTDLSHSSFSSAYIRDDRKILTTGKPLPDRAELIMDHSGVARWHLTTKLPITTTHGKVIGLIGLSRPLVKSAETFTSFDTFTPVLSLIDAGLKDELSIPSLAGAMNLSVSAFERRFKKTFQMTPQHYIQKVRIAATCQALLQSEKTVTQIAYEYGFSDQSHFCKVFRRIMGTSPGNYRKPSAPDRTK